jgi:hypothetical protein
VRSAGLCERCASLAECVHHRNQDRADNRTRNLLVLCRPCHARTHRFWLDRKARTTSATALKAWATRRAANPQAGRTSGLKGWATRRARDPDAGRAAALKAWATRRRLSPPGKGGPA